MARDVYANLLRDTRGMRREQALARESWFSSLPWDRKEEALFELEMVLKGLVCLGNPRNLPGPPRRGPAVAHDFREELRIVRDATERAIALARQLLGSRERAYTFTRYLETVLLEDTARNKLLKDQLTQDTPEESLFLLRNALASYVEIADGTLRLGRVSHRLFYALHGTITREVGRNAYFNPLVALEFRPEFDRIRNADVLDALHRVRSDAAHRVVSLTLLALLRAIRYTALVDDCAAQAAHAHRAYVYLAVLRSDLRALTRFLSERAADVIADGFERDLLDVRASDVAERFGDLASMCGSLGSLRGTLASIASSLQLEVRKTFERDLPQPETAAPGQELGPHLIVAAASLRAALGHAVETVTMELRPGEEVPGLLTDAGSRRAASARLRRDVWMFAQILRAFLAKASATVAQRPGDEWSGQVSFQFVREFLGHFRAIGYQLVRASDYHGLDPFMAALEGLRDVDLLEPERMERALRECRSLYGHLESLLDNVSRRSELSDVPFDKKDAAETLKIYLGAA